MKVGSHADAKGLEFKAVILPRLSDQHFPSPAAPGDSAGVLDVRASLELSRLFVAMTRARDMLVVTCAGAWSDHFARAKEAFDLS